jgi:hypothetical protein
MWELDKIDVAVEEKFELPSRSFENDARIPVEATGEAFQVSISSRWLGTESTLVGTADLMVTYEIFASSIRGSRVFFRPTVLQS